MPLACGPASSAGRDFGGTPRRALTVPPTRVVRRGQLTSVFVVENGVARVRLVSVSESEVLAGLSEGEVVILSPPAGVTDGRRVSAGGPVMAATYGAAGRLAAAFIHSKLTPLFIVASMALGALAVVALPREEEPQIIVPMVDVFVEMPGATPADVEQRVTRPMEQLLWEVPGVEYVYSTSSRRTVDGGRPLQGRRAEEAALVRLNQKLAANADRIPPGVIGPIVKPRSIDDVPILAVTVWSARYGDDQLRALAAQLRDAIAEVTDVSEVTLIGGRPRQVRVDVDPARLAAYGLDPLAVQRAIAGTNVREHRVGARGRAA